MLFLLAGSAGAGKTTVIEELGQLQGVAVHDFDEGGVPPGADTAWRQRRLEQWVQYAVQRQQDGVDVLLAGQSPLGELVACPSSAQVDGLAALLLDVDDRTRLQRLSRRDGERWGAADLEAFLGWASWHRDHARDPSLRPEVITASGASVMRWDRWSGWAADDPRWDVPTIYTTELSPPEVAALVSDRVRGVRAAVSSGSWPLTGSSLVSAGESR